ncbi:MAG: peptidase-like protein [Candidatus Solibacter sp.]|jgi:predicted esterase|nr:peptidase-like protein [Candidatus Solibacter sp.]
MLRALGCALAFACTAAGQTTVTLHSTVDGSEQPYSMYVPKTLDTARRYPLIISLHEEESNHIANLKHVFGVPPRYGETGIQQMMSLPALRDVDFLVACPFARGTMGYQGIAEQDVYDVLADVKRRYPVDEDRVYLTGASMGGGGALWLALTRPDVWAAVAPVCPDPMPGTVELAANALNLPVRFFHGEQDPAVPAEVSRQWQRRLMNLGSPVEYIEFPGVRHNAWDFAYRNGAIFEWFGKYKRNRDPDHVRFATGEARYRGAYWVRIDGRTTNAIASIDAVRTAAGVRVQTENVDAFTLTTGAKSLTVDGAPMRLKPGAALRFTRTAKGWTQASGAEEAIVPGPSVRGPIVPEPSVRGPIVQAVSGRHIYVYGANDPQGKKDAESAASWSSGRVRINLTLPVKADKDVTDQDLETNDLVLFGNTLTNTLIARFAGSFPLTLDPGAADYGLLFVAPVGRHLALVSSGRSWWTGADDTRRGGYRFAPPQYRVLSTFGDYILFKGSLAQVLAEGRFDENGKVPAEAAAALRAAGTVTVR